MRRSVRFACTAFVVASVAFAFGPVAAKTSEEQAVKECRKEMDWPNLPGKVKKSPGKIAELDACVKRKTGR